MTTSIPTGVALHDRLRELKPGHLTVHEWAVAAGLSRTFISDLKRAKEGGGRPRLDSLTKLLGVAGLKLDDLDLNSPRALAPAQARDPRVDLAELPNDVPLLGTAQGASVRVGSNDESVDVETGTLTNEQIGFARRPPSIAQRRKVYALLTEGDSMSPRYRHGDPIYVDGGARPAIGEDCVVQLAQDHGEGADMEYTSVMVKELVRRTGEYVELGQHNPALTFRLEMKRVAAIHRVIPWRELLW